MLGIRLYRWVLSPAKTFLLGANAQCRFNPSCSAYALEAIGRHGAIAGTWLALKRVARCHPWGGCGEDPVPHAPEEGGRHKAIPTQDTLALGGKTPAATMHGSPVATMLKPAA
jgi:putative membrane protein insertion efficiency factor